jgi:hypothetical protein
MIRRDGCHQNQSDQVAREICMPETKRSAHAQKAAKTPKAKKPWDLPPTKVVGDESADPIFLAVGKALSNWEHVENCLAQVFATFVGAHISNNVVDPAVRAYGAIVGFKSRVGMLNAAAKAYFNPARQLKQKADTWKDLKEKVTEFSNRRNDIAHASAELVFDTKTEKAWGFYLLPGLYASKKYPHDEPPTYMMTADQVSYFADEFAKLSYEVRCFQGALAAEAEASRRPSDLHNRK